MPGSGTIRDAPSGASRARRDHPAQPVIEWAPCNRPVDGCRARSASDAVRATQGAPATEVASERQRARAVGYADFQDRLQLAVIAVLEQPPLCPFPSSYGQRGSSSDRGPEMACEARLHGLVIVENGSFQTGRRPLKANRSHLDQAHAPRERAVPVLSGRRTLWNTSKWPVRAPGEA